MEQPPETSQNILAAMRRVERSQKWTADKAGIARTTFTRKLNGGTDYTISEVARIARALGVSPSELLPEEFRQAVAA